MVQILFLAVLLRMRSVARSLCGSFTARLKPCPDTLLRGPAKSRRSGSSIFVGLKAHASTSAAKAVLFCEPVCRPKGLLHPFPIRPVSAVWRQASATL